MNRGAGFTPRHDSFIPRCINEMDDSCRAAAGPAWEAEMAQIRIERKRTGLGWLWVIIALIVIAIVAWLLLGHRASTRAGSAPAGAAPSSMSQPADGQGVMPLAAA